MIRIILVDDHKLFRVGLRRMLQDAHGLQIVGEAGTGEEAVLLARELRPSIVLMDIWMPGIGGLEATRRIVRMQLDIKVIAVTACEHNPFPLQVLRAGACGYLSKGVAAEELILAIKKVFVGKRYVSSEIAQTLAMSTYEEGHASPFEQLSNREMQIMLMVVSCYKVNKISSDLHLSPKTVNSYRYRIFEKLSVSSDVEMTLMAVRHGMINSEANVIVDPL